MLSAPSFSLGLDLDFDTDIDISDLPTDAEEDEEEEKGRDKTLENHQSFHSNPKIQLQREENITKSNPKSEVKEEEKDGFPYDQFENNSQKEEKEEEDELFFTNQDPPRHPLKRLRRGPPPLIKSRNCDNSEICSNSNSMNLFENFAESKEDDLDFVNPKLPCYGYFCNKDSRIRVLVRERLPNFVPLGTKSSIEDNTQSVAENIDYMVSFGIEEESQIEGGWVNPRETAQNENIKRDTRKRKILSNKHKSGYWLTQNGRKVYVTKNGQELTGQSAYKNYTKETGLGYSKSKKKKTNSKKR